MCLDSSNEGEKETVVMYHCHGKGGNQYFEYTDGSIFRQRHSIHYEDPNFIFKRKNVDRNPDQVSLKLNFNLKTNITFRI